MTLSSTMASKEAPNWMQQPGCFASDCGSKGEEISSRCAPGRGLVRHTNQQVAAPLIQAGPAVAAQKLSLLLGMVSSAAGCGAPGTMDVVL